MNDQTAKRLMSLDVFRGLTIAAMMLVNNPGDWDHVYAPLEHAEWNGWTPTDLIFPFFIFISGVSMQMSLARRVASGASRRALWATTTRRAAVILLIGLGLNWSFLFEWQHLRVLGVLQRIALCTAVAAPIVLYTGRRAQFAIAAGLLVAYTMLMLKVPVPDAAGAWHLGSLQPADNTGAWLDRALLGGHLWSKSVVWDPEGLLGTLPAVAGLLLGVRAGAALREATTRGRVAVLAGTALAAIVAAYVLDATSMPINKSLWTPAYVLLSTGIAMLALVTLELLLDRGAQRVREPARLLARPFLMFGMNALFLFALAGLLGRALVFCHWPIGSTTAVKAALFRPIAALPIAPIDASLAYALVFTTLMFCVAWAMWRRRWFVKV